MARTDLKGHAELRLTDLNSTSSTRYDYLLAAPSDEQLTKYWTAWAVISLVGGSLVALFLWGILSSRIARKQPFNLYLIYLMIPDAVYSLLCGIVCMLNALNGAQTGLAICNFQMMFIVWGVGSNMWLNAAVSRELHTLLQDSQGRRRYRAPTRVKVTRQAVVIYVGTLFLGTWGLIESNNFPHYVASTSGLACLPVEHDNWRSSIFFWLVFFPLFGGIPVVYIHYVLYDVWKRKLMPPRGKRRLLTIYFGRIVIVFVLMWVPYMVILFVLATWMPAWIHFYGGTLSHLQGAVSAILCLLKPDIYLAVKRFFTCRCCQDEQQQRRRRRRDDNDPTQPETTTSTGSGRRVSRLFSAGSGSLLTSSWAFRNNSRLTNVDSTNTSGALSINNNNNNMQPPEPSGAAVISPESSPPPLPSGVDDDDDDDKDDDDDFDRNDDDENDEDEDDDDYYKSAALWPNENGTYEDDDEHPRPPATTSDDDDNNNNDRC